MNAFAKVYKTYQCTYYVIYVVTKIINNVLTRQENHFIRLSTIITSKNQFQTLFFLYHAFRTQLEIWPGVKGNRGLIHKRKCMELKCVLPFKTINLYQSLALHNPMAILSTCNVKSRKIYNFIENIFMLQLYIKFVINLNLH